MHFRLNWIVALFTLVMLELTASRSQVHADVCYKDSKLLPHQIYPVVPMGLWFPRIPKTGSVSLEKAFRVRAPRVP